MLGHFFTRGTSAFTSDRTLGLSDFMLASPKGRNGHNTVIGKENLVVKSVYISKFTSTYVCVYVYVHMYVYVHLYVYRHMYVCMHVCVF